RAIDAVCISAKAEGRAVAPKSGGASAERRAAELCLTATAVGRAVIALSVGRVSDGRIEFAGGHCRIADRNGLVRSGILRGGNDQGVGPNGDSIVAGRFGPGTGRKRAAAGCRAALSYGDRIAGARVRLTAEGNRSVGGDRVGPDRDRDDSFGGCGVAGGD